MSSRRRSGTLLLLAVILAVGLAACSSGHRPRAGSASTLPAGTITVDRWAPPTLSGGPSTANFCAALTAVYRHMGDLPHVVSKKVTEDILSDYVSYAPTVVAESPPEVRSSASVYVGTVSAYLRALVRSGLDMSRLPSGALKPLATAEVNAAYSSLYGYSQKECHYTIGGSSTPS